MWYKILLGIDVYGYNSRWLHDKNIDLLALRVNGKKYLLNLHSTPGDEPRLSRQAALTSLQPVESVRTT